jgi:hypothetical protein
MPFYVVICRRSATDKLTASAFEPPPSISKVWLSQCGVSSARKLPFLFFLPSFALIRDVKTLPSALIDATWMLVGLQDSKLRCPCKAQARDVSVNSITEFFPYLSLSRSHLDDSGLKTK